MRTPDDRAASPSPAFRRATVVGAVAAGLLGLLSLLPAGFSAMMFDAPGSEDSPLTIALVAGLMGAPIVLLGSAGLLATASARRGRRLTVLGFALPGLLLVYLMAVTSALDRFCGGQFVCK